jgi:hypothetical protein
LTDIKPPGVTHERQIGAVNEFPLETFSARWNVDVAEMRGQEKSGEKPALGRMNTEKTGPLVLIKPIVLIIMETSTPVGKMGGRFTLWPEGRPPDSFGYAMLVTCSITAVPFRTVDRTPTTGAGRSSDRSPYIARSRGFIRLDGKWGCCNTRVRDFLFSMAAYILVRNFVVHPEIARLSATV